jgi:DNA polymerase
MSTSIQEKQQFMEELNAEIRKCTKCPLHQSRTQAVPGEGPIDAKVMFIGEGPGVMEDRTGRPFVGPAGQFLAELLRSAGLKREEIWIGNTVKCRPPENRTPTTHEIAACNDYLVAQIALVQPKVICTLGSPAMKTILGPEHQISKVHGQVFEKSGMTIVPLYHPAAALHQDSLKSVLREDFVKLKGILAKELSRET